MATEQEVHEAGGRKCIEQNLNIVFVFWMLSKHTSSNQMTVKNILEFIKGNVIFLPPQKKLIQSICFSKTRSAQCLFYFTLSLPLFSQPP